MIDYYLQILYIYIDIYMHNSPSYVISPWVRFFDEYWLDIVSSTNHSLFFVHLIVTLTRLEPRLEFWPSTSNVFSWTVDRVRWSTISAYTTLLFSRNISCSPLTIVLCLSTKRFLWFFTSFHSFRSSRKAYITGLLAWNPIEYLILWCRTWFLEKLHRCINESLLYNICIDY